MITNQLIERVLQNAANPTISTDTGVEAAQQIGLLATNEEFEWALDGWPGDAPLWQPTEYKRRGYYCLQTVIAHAATSAEFW